MPFAEPTDVRDKLRNPEGYEFLSREDYTTILQNIESNLEFKGSGKRHVNLAVLESDDSSARSSTDPNPSSRRDDVVPPQHPLMDVARAHAADMRAWPIHNPPDKATPPHIQPSVHAYLAQTPDKGKGKGEITLQREPWNRRARRVYRGDEVAQSRPASPAGSDHASMPELVASNGDEQELIEV